MEGARRAEQLIAKLRWPVFLAGVVLLDQTPSPLALVALAAFCLSYNAAIIYVTATRERFAVYGRFAVIIGRLLDVVLITLAVAHPQKEPGHYYLLYQFVLISVGYSSTNLRTLLLTTLLVLTANVAALYHSAGMSWNSTMGSEVSIQSAILILGALAATYLAKGRTHDEITTGQGQRLKGIFECAARLTDTRDVHDMAQRVLRTAVAQTGAAGGELLLIDEQKSELVMEAEIEEIHLASRDETAANTARKTVADWVFSTGRELLTQPGQKMPSDTGDSACISIAAAPLVWASQGSTGQDVLGVIMVWNTPGVSFSNDDLDLTQALAALASVGIVNLRLYTDLQTSFLRTLQSLAKSLEARDGYTQGHSDRIAKVACTLANYMHVPSESIEMLRNAALLHDIGKVGVPDAVLRKSGKLTAEEWEIMRRHPIVSEEICRPLGLPEEVLFLVLHHQERLDGKGYPSGLEAHEQPLLLRILALADTFDAMRSKRPYRDPMPREELLAELNRCAGRVFDPTVVEALKALIENGELDQFYAEMDAELGVPPPQQIRLAA